MNRESEEERERTQRIRIEWVGVIGILYQRMERKINSILFLKEIGPIPASFSFRLFNAVDSK